MRKLQMFLIGRKYLHLKENHKIRERWLVFKQYTSLSNIKNERNSNLIFMVKLFISIIHTQIIFFKVYLQCVSKTVTMSYSKSIEKLEKYLFLFPALCKHPLKCIFLTYRKTNSENSILNFTTKVYKQDISNPLI